jgi:hypothetical protein
MSLISFHGKQEVKNFYVNRVKGHFLADEIVKGYYWENGKGCGIGCTIHSNNHYAYETELGIPVWLAKVEDRIFENLPNDRAEKWPIEFLEAINIGSDLNKIKIPFLIVIVESAREKFDHKKYPKQLAAIDGVLMELRRDVIDLDKLRKARFAADAYGYAATSAAAYAAYAAYAANAAAAAAYAADYAAYAADYAADYADARKVAYVKLSDKLLELIRECK